MENSTIAKVVDQAMSSNEFTAQFLSNRLYMAMGYQSANASAKTFIDITREKGGYYRRRADPEKDKRNTLILLYALGIELDPDVVAEINRDTGLQYPPENGVSYESILEIQKLMKGEHSTANPSELTINEKIGIIKEEMQNKGELYGLDDAIDAFIKSRSTT